MAAHSSLDAGAENTGSDPTQHAPPFPFRQFLAESPYQPPQWARHLEPAPPKRMNLGQFPTPIHRWALPDLPEGLEVYIKRDDLTGLQLSGNKVRKLEFLIADAKAKGADCVITIGGIQSNHCRATAVAAKYAGLDTHLILRTSKVRQRMPLFGPILVVVGWVYFIGRLKHLDTSGSLR
jgi:D-cysteine desulfhydrase